MYPDSMEMQLEIEQPYVDHQWQNLDDMIL